MTRYLCCIHCVDVAPHEPDQHVDSCLGKGCVQGTTKTPLTQHELSEGGYVNKVGGA